MQQERETLWKGASAQPSQRTGMQTLSGTEKEESPYGFNGEPLSRPPVRTSSGQVRRSRTDNSVDFPAQVRSTQPSGRPAGTAQRKTTAKRRRKATASDPKRKLQSQKSNGKKQRLRPTNAQPVRDPVQREKRRKRQVTRAAMRRRRMMRRLAAFAMLIGVIAIGGYLTVTMLFRIQTIQVQTADGSVVEQAGGYSSQSILQVLGVELEENIFSFEPGERAAVLERQFPLLESIRVLREYPNTVVVQVTEATPAYTIQSVNGWLILSQKFKILSCEAQQPDGLTVLYATEPSKTAPGETLELAQQEPDGVQESSTDWMNILLSLRQGLQQYDLMEGVTRIEFADPEQIAFLYQDRISVLLGTLNDLDYKLERAAYVLYNEDGKGCGPTDTGKLDFSHASAGSNRRIYFAQGEPTLPSGYVVPTPEPVPEVTDAVQDPETDLPAAESMAETTQTEGA